MIWTIHTSWYSHFISLSFLLLHLSLIDVFSWNGHEIFNNSIFLIFVENILMIFIYSYNLTSEAWIFICEIFRWLVEEIYDRDIRIMIDLSGSICENNNIHQTNSALLNIFSMQDSRIVFKVIMLGAQGIKIIIQVSVNQACLYAT